MINLPKYVINKMATSNYACHLDNPRRRMTDNVRQWKVEGETCFCNVTIKTVEEINWIGDVVARWHISYEEGKPSWFDKCK
jgi:hypothetical protein